MTGTVLTPLAPASAFDPSQPPHLVDVGPKDPITGAVILSPQTNFPVYYQDSTGLALELCTANNDQLNMCIYDAIDPTDTETLAYQQQIGFNAEAFWWAADSSVTMPTSPDCPDCRSGDLTLAVEAAFNQERPVKGDEFMFGRIRIRIDAPYSGTYRVTHPFGVKDFYVAVPDRRAINETIDVGTIGPDPTGPLRSGIMSFLRWDPAVEPQPPQGYIGDANVPHPVIGSPLGTNYFKIEHLGDNGSAPRPLGPNNAPFVQENNFEVSGRLYSGVVPTPLAVDRATYSGTRVEVMARSAATATLGVAFDGGTEHPMVGDGNGNFWYAASDTAMPQAARVTAKNANTTDTTINAAVSDVVDITEAKYDPAAKTLSVAATSSVPTAALSLVGYGNPAVGYTGSTVISNVVVPPPVLQVRSDHGGVDQEPVVLLGDSTPGTPGGGPGGGTPTENLPLAKDDLDKVVVINTPTTIDVAANDVPAAGATINRMSVVITTPPQKGTIGLIGVSGVTYTPNSTFTTGSDTFQYKISDNQGRQSATPATVTVAIAPEQLTVDSAIYRSSTLSWTIDGTTNATIGNTITAYFVATGSTTRQLIGSATVDGAGAYSVRADRSSVVPGPAGGTVTVVSSKGTTLENRPLTRLR
ncbi:MAG TPA: Ig-like domain-containing protein [Azospirillum sp.]|nr:Ig-like domain-containing protein [Azospirillum sp.]